MKISLCLLFLLTFFSHGNANSSFGGKVGLSLQFGTHIQRIGVMCQLYYYTGSFQFNQGSLIHYNRKNLGPQQSGFELQTNLGFQGYWGGTAEQKKYHFSEFSLMTNQKYSVGYCLKFFLDQNETNQFTGSIFTNINRFSFVFENDLFGFYKGFQDKYRTGALTFSYQLDSFLISMQTTHWTGKSIDGPHIKDTIYPSKYGYRDLSKVKHGKVSHGILAARLDYYWKYGQVARLESGIDAEQVRHALQNKLIHDNLPAKIIKYENPHYPMLQEDGMPYLFKEGQKVKSARWYFQTGLNQMMFY